jgi:predicted PurR-regulated permease PerM
MVTFSEKGSGLGTVLLGLALGFLFFYTMAPFMIALVIGAIIALLCFPMHRALIQHRFPAWISGGILTLGVGALILGPLVFVAVSVAYRLASLLRGIQLPQITNLSSITEHPLVASLVARIPPWMHPEGQWLHDQGLSLIQKSVTTLSELTGRFLGGIPGLLLGFTVVIIATYFFIVDGKRFTRFLLAISPLKPEKSKELFEAFATSCRGVVLGMLAASVTQGVCIALLFGVTQTPNALLWGLTGVIMGMVPVIGTAPILLGGIAYHAIEASYISAALIVAGAALISASDNIVRSWVLKGHGEMHPLLGLVSAFGAVSVLGPTGIILGPIIAAVFVAFLEMLGPVVTSTTGKE